MNLVEFTPNSAGQTIRVGTGEAAYSAFMPAPLPPLLKLDPSLVRMLSNADRALGELAGLGRTIANPHLLIQPFIRREAVLSSRIEGTQADVTDLYAYEAGQLALPGFASTTTEPDVREVLNYVHALEYGLKRMDELPVSLRLLRELHERLLIHYHFECIHPFVDGNGRIGRLLITLLLVHWNLLPLPLLYLSAFFERNRQQYYDHLLAVSQKGEWEDWLRFFLSGVAEQAHDAVARAKRLQDLQRRWRQSLQKDKSPVLCLSIADYLFERPVINTSHLKERFEASLPAILRAIRQLEKQGIVKEVSGRTRNQQFVATAILDATELT